jgi:hypothetical protein
MIGHRDVGVHRHVVCEQLLREQVKVVPAIHVVDENGAPIHLAVRDVQRNGGDLEARDARHGERLQSMAGARGRSGRCASAKAPDVA